MLLIHVLLHLRPSIKQYIYSDIIYAGIIYVSKRNDTKQCISNVAFYSRTENITKHSRVVSFGLQEIQSPPNLTLIYTKFDWV